MGLFWVDMRKVCSYKDTCFHLPSIALFRQSYLLMFGRISPPSSSQEPPMAPVESEDSTKMNGFALLGAFPPPPTQPVNVTDRHFNGIIRSVLLSSGESATTTWGFPEISAQVSGRERVDAKRVDSFKQFQKSVTLLREQLSMMARDIRSICRHHEVIHSVIRLDKALEILHFLVYENAAALYPQDGKIQFQDGRQEYYGYKLNGHHFEQPGASSEYFTTQLKKVLVSLRTFYNCLMAVPDFRRHAGEGSLTAFEEDLEFWFLHCSDFPRARFREHTIRLFMLELSKHIKHDMDGMCEVITSLRKEAITVLKREQQERSSRYTYLTAVATLLSGVTATMLQFQGGTSKSAADANATFAAFWYLSLVLSIACAVNSLAGYAWIETKFLDEIPHILRVWLHHSPMLTLVPSMLCFAVAIMVYVYASDQNKVTSAITTAATIASGLGLIIALTWLLPGHIQSESQGDVEKPNSKQEELRALQRPSQGESHPTVHELRADDTHTRLPWLCSLLQNVSGGIQKKSSSAIQYQSIEGSDTSGLKLVSLLKREAGKMRHGNGKGNEHRQPEGSSNRSEANERVVSRPLLERTWTSLGSILKMTTSPDLERGTDLQTLGVREATGGESVPPNNTRSDTESCRQRLQDVPETATERMWETFEQRTSPSWLAAIHKKDGVKVHHLTVLLVYSIMRTPLCMFLNLAEEGFVDESSTRRAAVGQATADPDVHQATAKVLVEHQGQSVIALCLSRSKNILVTAGWDRTLRVLKVPVTDSSTGEQIRYTKKAEEPEPLPLQLLSMFSGDFFLERTTKGIWIRDGERLEKTNFNLVNELPDQIRVRNSPGVYGTFTTSILVEDHKGKPQRAADGKELLRERVSNCLARSRVKDTFWSAEGAQLIRFSICKSTASDAANSSLPQISIEREMTPNKRFCLRVAAHVPETSYLILSAVYLSRDSRPRIGREQHNELILLHEDADPEHDKDAIMHRQPLLHEISHIVASNSQGYYALVSYGRKSPRLWKIEEPDGYRFQKPRLRLLHAFFTSLSVEFSGPSCFAGPQDQIVLRGTRTGTVHVWMRKSAEHKGEFAVFGGSTGSLRSPVITLRCLSEHTDHTPGEEITLDVLVGSDDGRVGFSKIRFRF